jgi:ankyrin repeat protein
VRLLAEHGADLDARGFDGRTAYALAVRRRRADVAAELERLGASSAVSLDDELIGGIARGERPIRVPELDADAREVVVEAALDREDVALVVELYGLDLRGWGDGTLLHMASWQGKPDVVERLLALGSDPSARAATDFDTPLGWAVHGSRYGPPGDHVAVAERLVDAGAQVEPRLAGVAGGPLAEWLERRASAA